MNLPSFEGQGWIHKFMDKKLSENIELVIYSLYLGYLFNVFGSHIFPFSISCLNGILYFPKWVES